MIVITVYFIINYYFFQVADEVDLNKVLFDLGIDQLASFVPMKGEPKPRGLFYIAKNSSLASS